MFILGLILLFIGIAEDAFLLVLFGIILMASS